MPSRSGVLMRPVYTVPQASTNVRSGIGVLICAKRAVGNRRSAGRAPRPRCRRCPATSAKFELRAVLSEISEALAWLRLFFRWRAEGRWVGRGTAGILRWKVTRGDPILVRPERARSTVRAGLGAVTRTGTWTVGRPTTSWARPTAWARPMATPRATGETIWRGPTQG